MIPLSQSKFNDLRYLASIFFVPYLFLGLLIKFISERFSGKYMIPVIVVIFLPLLYTNLTVIADKVSILTEKNMSCNSSRSITLGEIEPVAAYMILHSENKKLMYFEGDRNFRVVFNPLKYLLRKQGIDSIKTNFDQPKSLEGENSGFIISCSSPKEKTQLFEKIGNIYVHHVEN
jgi:hypothetical protein